MLTLVAAVLLAACVPKDQPAGSGGAGYGDQALAWITADMDPATLALAHRHDPRPHTTYWGRVPGWERIDLSVLPSLGFDSPAFADAQAINANIPIADVPQPAPRFVLQALVEDRTRALHCLSQAIYFEAGYEVQEGKRAVAQVVLNRLRHGGYPKTVCGVVYQGAQRASGCQFSFTCDGSLHRPPNPLVWADAQGVARAALSDDVEAAVGTATHYHTNYVAPYWAPTMVKLAKIGAHIFYRWTGPGGEPAALDGRYAGQEANLSAALLQSDDARTPVAPQPKIIQLDQGNGVLRSYVIGRMATIAPAPIESLLPLQPGIGVLTPTRRKPTSAEVAAINAALAKLPQATPLAP